MPAWQQALYGVLTLVLMFGMGASLDSGVFRRVLRRPEPFWIGLLCQFALLPLLGIGAAQLLDLGDTDTLGLVLMVTVGGGNASNMLTYLARGDLALSLSMTVTATLASVGLTPLWLSWVANQGVTVPLGAVALTVAMMAVPVPLGMLLRAHRPALALRLDRGGRLAGAVLLALILATGAADVLGSIARAPTAVYVACGLVSGCGMVIGSLVGRLVGSPRPQWLAVGLETGVQNLPAALAIVAVAFPAADHAALQRVPLLYATTALLLGSGWAFVHRPR